MKSKHKVRLFVLAAAAISSLFVIMAANFFIDPFGVFGDRIFNWYSYNFTNNPQSAKIAYLDNHHTQYESYIVGASTAAAYSTEQLEDYTGEKFFNLFSYGASMSKNLDIVRYIAENYEVKTIVMPFGLREWIKMDPDRGLTSNPHYKVSDESAMLFFAKYLFADPAYAFSKVIFHSVDTYLPQKYDVFRAYQGDYDKRVRDVEYIGDMDEYLESNSGFFENANYDSNTTLNNIEKSLGELREIRDICDSYGIRLILVFSPEYHEIYNLYSEEEINSVRQAVADSGGYWDFSLVPESADARYFYDDTHCRNALAHMVLARVFDDPNCIQEESGVYNPEGQPAYAPAVSADEYTAEVSVLLYHHIAEDPQSNETITPECFERQMRALYEAGYTAVSMRMLRDYVYNGIDLPERSVLITFDDGYYSNYEYAFTVLQKYGFHASIFVIGTSFGKDTYKDTGEAITPHFGASEAREMLESGLIEIQSHTFDMHQVERFDSPARKGAVKFSFEKEEDYIDAFTLDYRLEQELLESINTELYAFAYPYGNTNEFTDVLLYEKGVELTFSTKTGVNTLIKGLPQSLLGLKRFSIGEDTDLSIYLDMN